MCKLRLLAFSQVFIAPAVIFAQSFDATPVNIVVGPSSGVTNSLGNVSINNARQFAFTANDSVASKVWFVPTFGTPVSVVGGIFGSTRTYSGVALQNGTNPRIIARDLSPGPATLVRSWGTDGSGFVILGSNVSSPFEVDSATGLVDINDNGIAAYVGLVSGSTSTALMMGSVRPFSQIATYSGSVLLRPQMSNTNDAVVRSTTGSITVWHWPTSTATTSTNIGSGTLNRPGISQDGKVVAFGGNRGNGPGVFIHYKKSDNTWTTVPIAGDLILNGVTDLPDSQRISVAHQVVGNLQRVTVAFFGTVNGLQGLHRLDVMLENDALRSIRPIEHVANIGVPYGGFGPLTGIGLYDPMNEFGDTGFFASSGSIFAVASARKFTFKQGDTHWKNDTFASGSNTVGAKGCYLTAITQLSRLYDRDFRLGNYITPKDANAWVSKPGNFNADHDFNPEAITAFTGGVTVGMRQVDRSKTDNVANDPVMLATINSYLAAGIPVILHVRGGLDGSSATAKHFVLAVATRKENKWDTNAAVDTYVIYDPADRTIGATKLDVGSLNNSFYKNEVYGYRVWQPGTEPTVSFSIHSPATMLITDPQGRRAGVDPTNGTVYTEIPGSNYGIEGGISDPDTGTPQDEEYPLITINGAQSGDLTVQVNGTGSGPYTVNSSLLTSASTVVSQSVTGIASSGSQDTFKHSTFLTSENSCSFGPVNGHSISGIVTLDGYAGATPIEFSLRNGDGTVVQSWTRNLSQGQSYGIGIIAPGAYTLFAKGDRWLRRSIPITIASGDLSGVNFSLLNGDVDNDNNVSIFDFIILSDAFDAGFGDPRFDERADLDGDGSISIFDYILMSDNFDKTGDD